jgi:hypothetical protein
LKLQQLSLRFYNLVLPRYIQHLQLGLHLNKLFSYGIDEDDLFVYDCEERLWDIVPQIVFEYAPNQFKRHLNHSAQIVAMQSKVYLLGGSQDNNYNLITDDVR